jgi:hypothetical protein
MVFGLDMRFLGGNRRKKNVKTTNNSRSPFGDDNQKGKGNGKATAKQKQGA